MKHLIIALCIAVFAGLALPNVGAMPVREVAVGNGSCLTAQQVKELHEAIVGIQATLKTTILALNIAIAAESDPTTKKDLQEAVTIIQAVSKVLVTNLTKIVESACGTCLQIAQVINETVVVLENTLTQIDPDWKTNPVFQVIVSTVNDILNIVELVCPNNATVNGAAPAAPKAPIMARLSVAPKAPEPILPVKRVF